MMAIRLVTIDLDGTLLDSGQRTSARSLGALGHLHLRIGPAVPAVRFLKEYDYV